MSASASSAAVSDHPALSSTSTPHSSDNTVSLSLINRCGDSKSPYVRSHLSNPTAWQLWTPDTIALAQKTNRLLFVSIGYSACHWCHVMAHESFDDPHIAKILNEHFIPVKIDREERPDIDRQYMDFLQATSGGGGWPLNVFVTPDLEPIFGGTYWPSPSSERASRGGGPDFEQILLKVAGAWKEQEQRCRDSAKQIIQQLREFAQEGMLGERGDGKPDDGQNVSLELDILEDAFVHYRKRFDSKYGGFGGAPKFPTPVHIRPLLRVACYTKEVREIVGEDMCVEARDMAVKTLECMAKGGMKDQVGHGFARYSVTRDWSLPHFEKMLYDNAQLLPVYLDAYLVTKSPLFLDTLKDIATYLTSPPMASPLGGINSSEDADSLPTSGDEHKREGAYYVWKIEEFRSILDEEEFNICRKYWGVHADGNIDARFDPQGELAGQNTLCVRYEVPALASELGMETEKVDQIVQSGRRKLQAYRESNRPRPALDDKIVTAWNGLAIGGLSRAGAALKSSHPEESAAYINAAQNSADCIRTHLLEEETQTLRRVFREGPGDTPGFADDYAFFILGLIDLYEATFDSKWLALADRLQQTQNRLFWDEEKYAFFSTPAEQPDILIRTKDAMDNSEPSVNGVSASNLFRLSSLLNDETYAKMAKRTLSCFEVEISQHPGLFSGMLSSVVAADMGMRSLIISGAGELAQAAVRIAQENIRPNYTVLRVSGNASDTTSPSGDWLLERNPLLRDLDASVDKVQLCEGTSCTLLDLTAVEALFSA
ncbi:uncharacterized protein K489DRAFT_366495 [Dissoconium aciculare CBS 342.82]|uniref:Spermatogenesis-associated protein 20-like TRX domain-containing protein n=1 Tax=Dissoconium aciculare CBS 342.82 TaxID=1314786 RepID=A0A6J3MHA7_9PEZI|nr:uncharacterized protein K489DRAFT_366495 [Dissoconium aciculare CBS 342.82]KAF1827325.1 hypothetical protein K489DRAFT_366495 [Dissoconium aciculare CBS 342.82]